MPSDPHETSLFPERWKEPEGLIPEGSPARRADWLLGAAWWLAAVGILAVLVWLIVPRGLVSNVTLRGERGVVGRGMMPLGPGERLRLEIELRSPAAALVFLEDPSGSLSAVHPPPGDAAVNASRTLRLPPGAEGAWDTAGLQQGIHALWVLAGKAPIPETRREEIEVRLKAALRGSPPRPFGRPEVLRAVESALRPEIVQAVEKDFRVD